MNSTVLCFIGVDPGPVTGLAVAYWDGESWAYPGAYQCDAASAAALAAWLARKNWRTKLLGAIEEFRPGTGAGARGLHATVTRNLVNEITAALVESGMQVKTRPAAAVKPWATDDRLRKAGLYPSVAGLPHATDAMRHALFLACRDAGVPDPLSRRRSA